MRKARIKAGEEGHLRKAVRAADARRVAAEQVRGWEWKVLAWVHRLASALAKCVCARRLVVQQEVRLGAETQCVRCNGQEPWQAWRGLREEVHACRGLEDWRNASRAHLSTLHPVHPCQGLCPTHQEPPSLPSKDIVAQNQQHARHLILTAAPQCSAVRGAIVGDGGGAGPGGSGLVGTLRALETQLRGVMAREEALGELLPEH